MTASALGLTTVVVVVGLSHHTTLRLIPFCGRSVTANVFTPKTGSSARAGTFGKRFAGRDQWL